MGSGATGGTRLMTTPRKLPHELCLGLTGKVKLKPTPEAAESQTVIYARAKPGRGTFTGQDGQAYTLRGR